MGLPAELRLMIYEHLPKRTMFSAANRDKDGKPKVILVLRFVERDILQTCKLIRREANPVVNTNTLKYDSPRIITDYD